MDFTKAILYDWLCLVYFFAIMYPTGSINNIYINVFMLMYCIWFFFHILDYCIQLTVVLSTAIVQFNTKSTRESKRSAGNIFRILKFFWYDIREIFSYLFQAYVTGFSISNFFIPLIVLICTNASICITIWKNMGQFTQINLNLQNQVRKMPIFSNI